MSAIADFSVAVLDCQTCCRHFIENHLSLIEQRERVACPHCGAHYVAPANSAADSLHYAYDMARLSHRRRGALHALGQARRKLH